MAERIKARPGAIGYVDFAQARRSGLSYASLRNRAGQFVEPSLASFQEAAAQMASMGSEVRKAEATRTDETKAYPIVATTYAVLPAGRPLSQRRRAVLDYFRWSFQNGDRIASELGYVPLASELAFRNETVWAADWGFKADRVTRSPTR